MFLVLAVLSLKVHGVMARKRGKTPQIGYSVPVETGEEDGTFQPSTFCDAETTPILPGSSYKKESGCSLFAGVVLQSRRCVHYQLFEM